MGRTVDLAKAVDDPARLRSWKWATVYPVRLDCGCWRPRVVEGQPNGEDAALGSAPFSGALRQ